MLFIPVETSQWTWGLTISTITAFSWWFFLVWTAIHWVLVPLFLESTKWILNLYSSLFPPLLFSRQWPPRHQALAYSGQPWAPKHESHQAKRLTKPTHQGPCFPTETFHSIGNEVTQQGTRGTSEKTLVPRIETGGDVRRHGETWYKPPGQVTFARGSFVLEHIELKTKRTNNKKPSPDFF